MNKLYVRIIALSIVWMGINQTMLLAQPANDSAINAVLLPVDGMTHTYSNVGATAEAGEQALGPDPANDGAGFQGWSQGETNIANSIWFKFVAPASGAVSIDLCGGGTLGTDFDTQMGVYEAGDSSDFATYTLLAANDDWPGCSPFTFPNTASPWASYVEVPCLTPGNTYMFLVDGFLGSVETGTAGIVLNEIPGDPLSLGAVSVRDVSCPGGASGAITVNATSGFAFDVMWDNGITDTLLLSDLSAGTYTVTLTDACDSVTTFPVTVSEPDSVVGFMVDAGDDVSICQGDQIELGGTPVASGGVPNGGNSVYSIVYTGGGNLLANTSVENNENYNPLSTTGLPFSGLRSMDFAFGNIIFALSVNTGAAAGELIAITPDPVSPTATNVGPMTPLAGDFLVNIMYDDLTETMWATAFDTLNFGTRYYTVDVSSGALTAAGYSPNVTIAYGASFDASGTLYVVDANDSLYTADPNTGATTTIGYVGVNLTFINVNDMDFDPVSGGLFMSYYTDLGNVVAEIDLNTGLLMPLGFMEIPGNPNFSYGGFAISPPVSPDDVYTFDWFPPASLDATDVPHPISSATSSRFYILTATETCGTSVSDTINITVNPSPTVSATSSPDNGTLNGTATATPSGGVGTFTYVWVNSTGDTVSTDQTAMGLATGTYTVTAIDENGCDAVTEVFVDTNVGIDDLLKAGINSFNVYPNPSNGVVSIQVELENIDQLRISLLDLRGKMVWEGAEQTSSLFEQKIDISHLPSGTYLVQVRTSTGSSLHKLTLN
ncbi:MAG: T9SS type A sorting domain-containing protein [Bacteroidota bacterium]